MAFTQSQLDALEAALATGTLTVEYAEKRVTYRSQAEMIALRNLMKNELASASGAVAQRTTYVSFG